MITFTIPEKMCHTNIILLYNRGDKANIGNYRPMSLSPIFTKFS